MSFVHGGELIARSLKIQGVSTIYTLCGGHIAPIYDGCANNGIHIIDFRHEQAAAHAADAHARLTRNIGVCVVTAGPGVTDAVTGVANAYQARSPMILIGGAAPLQTKGMGALQEMPQTDMFKTFTKASFTITNTADIPQLFHDAYVSALSGRPGPVFIEVPFDVLFNTADTPAQMPAKVVIDPIMPELGTLKKIFDLLRHAQKPLIIAGTQVYWDDASQALRELTDATGIPVYTNGGGRGTLPMNHPHCFKASRGKALKEADVVLMIGTPLDFRLKYGQGWHKEAKLIQVENDPAELNHNRQADIAMCADSRLLLEALGEGLQGLRYDAWLEQVRELEKPFDDEQNAWKQLPDMPINHFRMGGAINEFLDENTILIGDGGDIVSACAKVIDLTYPGQWLDPGPLGCLGVGAPFAVAAKHLFPHKKVLIINGDGAFGLNGFEFDTALRFNLPIVSIVGNDAGWGQIRLPLQNMMGEERAFATGLALTRYDKVVEALGGYGEFIENPDDIVGALERAFASGTSACINVVIDPKGLKKTGASTPYIV
jgi:acetolactate synthase I/II/III large subunit